MSGWCSSDLGSLYGEMGNTKGAMAHYQQALTVVRQLGDKEAENSYATRWPGTTNHRVARTPSLLASADRFALDSLMADCIFCDIIANLKPGVKVYEDDVLLAIEDIHPRTPVHLLIMPKWHVPTLLDIEPDDTVWLRASPL